MTKMATLKKQWLKDPKVRVAYEELSLEYAIAKKLLAERLKANMTQTV